MRGVAATCRPITQVRSHPPLAHVNSPLQRLTTRSRSRAAGTYGLLRQVEKESVEANFFQTAAAQAAAKAAPYPSTMRTMPDGSIFVARR